MCYRSSKGYTIRELEDFYEVRVREEFAEKWETPLFNDFGFDHNPAPILTKMGMGIFSWGLIPSGMESLQKAIIQRRFTLNCRSQEMFETKSYAKAITAQQRCIIPLTGIIENQQLDKTGKPVPGGKEKQPYHFVIPKQKIFSVAGLYDTWEDPQNGQMWYTYTLMTTTPNKLFEEIHNKPDERRMPVIIPKELEKDWLNNDLTKEDVWAICQPFKDGVFQAYPIDRKINKKRPSVDEPDPNNNPEILSKVEVTLTEKPEPKKAVKKTKGDSAQGSLF
jgi:putative SOS response-associated peptidase YedK